MSERIRRLGRSARASVLCIAHYRFGAGKYVMSMPEAAQARHKDERKQREDG